MSLAHPLPRLCVVVRPPPPSAAPSGPAVPPVDAVQQLLGAPVVEADDGQPRGMRRNAPSRDGPNSPMISDRPPFKAFLRNLAYSATSDDIGRFLESHDGVKVTDVRVLTGQDGRPSGNALVTLADRKSLVRAIELSGSDICGRRCEIRVDEKPGNDRGGGGSYRGGGSGSGSRDRDGEGFRVAGGGGGGGRDFGGSFGRSSRGGGAEGSGDVRRGG